MTLRISTPLNARSVMPGDVVRITSPEGARIPLLGASGENLIKFAFGKVEAHSDGSRVIKMHEFMPEEIRALQEIKMTDHTLVERLNADQENDLALAGFAYLQRVSKQLLQRLASTPGQRQVMVAALEKDGRRILGAMSAAGYAVFEQSTAETVTQKKLYISQDAAGVKSALERGENPSDTHIFDMGEQTTARDTHAVNNVEAALDLLFSKSQAGQPQPQNPTASLSPFMRNLVGDDSIRLEDLDDNDHDQSQTPRG